MQEIVIGKNEAGQRSDKLVMKYLNQAIPESLKKQKIECILSKRLFLRH